MNPIICKDEKTKQAMKEWIWANYELLTLKERTVEALPRKAAKAIAKVEAAFYTVFASGDLVPDSSDGRCAEWERPLERVVRED